MPATAIASVAISPSTSFARFNVADETSRELISRLRFSAETFSTGFPFLALDARVARYARRGFARNGMFIATCRASAFV
jgi:hypothetical protein